MCHISPGPEPNCFPSCENCDTVSVLVTMTERQFAGFLSTPKYSPTDLCTTTLRDIGPRHCALCSYAFVIGLLFIRQNLSRPLSKMKTNDNYSSTRRFIMLYEALVLAREIKLVTRWGNNSKHRRQRYLLRRHQLKLGYRWISAASRRSGVIYDRWGIGRRFLY